MAAVALALLAAVVPLGLASAVVVPPSFGSGCVRPAEHATAKQQGPGTRRKVIERGFGAEGAPAANMYGWTGRFRVYYACSQKAWNRRFGKGPQYWIVLAKYREGRLVGTRATNRGYRP